MIFCFAYLKYWVLLFITLLVFLVILYLLKLQSKKIIHKPKTKETLKYLILSDIPLKNIDTSLIQDMSYLFSSISEEKFIGIETWDTSNVDNMEGMFLGCKNFNSYINN